MPNKKSMIGLEEFTRYVIDLEGLFSENKEKLTELDSVVGDGDHGENMVRGFSNVAELLEEDNFTNFAELFQEVGRELIKSIGGAAGPIFGSFFLGMKEGAKGKSKLDLEDLANCFEYGLKKVKDRGGAEPGDKTMVDVLEPVTKRLKEIVSGTEKNSIDCEILEQAYKKAKEGVKNTAEMEGQKGRSSFSGERSKGKQDPGAMSMRLIIGHLYSFFCQ